MKRLTLVFAAVALVVGGCARLKAIEAPAPAIPVAMVPEMEPIPGFDGGMPCEPGEFAGDAAKAAADWAAKRPGIAPLVTAGQARGLSRWAKKPMEQYKRVPPLDKVVFAPVAHHKDARHLVLAGTVDTLPSHSRLVTRWLKVYLLYDQEKQAVVRAAVTIRGERLE